MRKENLGSKLVKKAITWAMIAMMSLSGVMSNIATMTAYAEGNEINNHVDDLGLSNEYVDSDKAEYHNDEAAEVAQNSDSVKAMNEQVNKAQDAVAKADAAVTDAEKAVTDAANDATEKVKTLEDKKTVENIEDYNKQVAADQNDIENNAETDASVKSAEDAAATAANEADKAKDAAEAAQAALEKALDVDTDKVNQEVQDAVDEANAAAKAAAEAAEAAKDAKTTAEAEANKIIAEYNLYAMSYGLPLYEETTVTYSTEEAKAAVEAAGMVYQAGERARLEDEVKDINDTTLEAEKANVDAAVKALDTAQEALVTAENSAKDAAEAAAEASKAVADADATADKAADAVNNYYVTPAQEAVDAANKAIGEKKAVEEEVKKMDAVNATISNAKDFVENASDQLDKAKDAYDAAEERLNKLQESVNQKTFDSITLKALQDKIAAAQAAVKAADDELKKAEVQKAAAQNYANWANQLVTDHYTRAYAQVTKDADGNNILLTENLKQYDLKNDEVISRSTNDFTCVSPGTDSVKVPYAIYRDYVEAMYKKYQADQVNSGKGTSTGDNMDVIYWEVDENGVLTGKYFDSIDDLSTGRYFVGYSFKQEKDGYHLDGVMWDYTKEAEPTVTPAPAGGGSDGSGPSGDGGTSTVTIVDGAVALAAAPNADQAVLGARRVPNADQAVLGAKRGVDQAVLGKRRRPETGDSAAVILWMMALAVSAATAVVATTQLKKKKENE